MIKRFRLQNFKNILKMNSINIRYFNEFSKPDAEDSHPDFQPKRNQIFSEEIPELHKQIKDIINNNKIVLFMKGTPENPMCGYSRFVSQLLKFYGIEEYKSVDILENNLLRQEAKVVTEWPTFPQLHINGEFIGGSDIISEMHKDGTFKDLVNSL